MDDSPAGPARPEPGRPRLSVVIPVHNGGGDFERCLRRLRESTWTDFELLVVDDGSTDRSGALALEHGARVITHETPRGPAAARNNGALSAQTPIIFFLDADVALHPDALGLVYSRFEKDPDVSALFGSYDESPAAPGIVSQFRNLLHHHVHQTGEFVDDARRVRTFWTGCGAIRRDTFLALGGFDPQLYSRPAIEDIELGYRLERTGHKVLLVRNIFATHMKRWTTWSMIKTDVFQRGVPWMLLLWRMKTKESDLNVSRGQRLCVAAVGLGGMALALCWFQPLLLTSLVVVPSVIIAINSKFYRFLANKKGIGFAIASLPLHAIYYCCCGASVVIALGIRLTTELEPWSESSTDSESIRVDSAQSAKPRSFASRVFSRSSKRWTKK